MIKSSDGLEFVGSGIEDIDAQIDLLALFQWQWNSHLGEASCFAHHCGCRGCWMASRGVGDLMIFCGG